MSSATGYVILWIILSFFPLITAWRKRWSAFAVYMAGWILFLYSTLERKDGWDQLADIATLIVVIIPIYLAASTVWLLSHRKKRRK